MKEQQALILKSLTKSNVWDIQENDVFRMWEASEKDADLKDNMNHYLSVLKSAFDIEEIKIDKLGYGIKNGTKTKDLWDGTISFDKKPCRIKVRNIAGDETTISV